MRPIFLFIVLVISTHLSAQKTGTLKGRVTDANGKPVAQVNITYKKGGTTSAADGSYQLTLPADKKVVVTFSHLSYGVQSYLVRLKRNEIRTMHVKFKEKTESLEGVVIKQKSRKEKEGGVKIGKMNIIVTPGAQAGVENLLKTLPSASGFDEMSSQYMVRGGNFDENQVYINGIEVYRPFLIRSGQQEGLSFVNSDLIENIFFYPGGFGADQGDKLSSVLDITYKNPKKNQTKISLSMLGGSISNEFKKHKWSNLSGIRYRDKTLLINNRGNVQSDNKPIFADFQNLLRYDANKKFYVEFLSNISLNLYHFYPHSKTVNFGSFQDSKSLYVGYEGLEKDNYRTYFGAIKTTYKPTENKRIEISTSVYNTQEEEHFDILGQYSIGTPNGDLTNPDFGEPENLESLGSDINHARNDLDALIANLQIKYHQKINKKHIIEAGTKLGFEDIKDRINEWQVIDSAGFSLYPPGSFQIEEPYDIDTAPILPYQRTKSFNHALVKRATGFVLLRSQYKINKQRLWTNVGIRSQFYEVNDEFNHHSQTGFTISPRLLVGYKPKQNLEFRLATGLYQQAPFYKEFRNQQGLLNIGVKPQKSYIVSLANDWYFDMWQRPFKLTSEVYYKYLWDVNPYTLENVRIRYFANNNATAFAYGFETRLNGEFIAGIESWFSLGLMKTMENIDQKGYIYRPTDQRYKFAMLFQDYVPRMPNMRMYLNMTLNGGIPTGSPSYADPYEFQFRTNSYYRTDIGMFYVIKDENTQKKSRFLNRFKYLSAGFEILNMFDTYNSISNMWVRDIYSKKVYRVKNYLTGRLFNFKLNMKL